MHWKNLSFYRMLPQKKKAGLGNTNNSLILTVSAETVQQDRQEANYTTDRVSHRHLWIRNS